MKQLLICLLVLAASATSCKKDNVISKSSVPEYPEAALPNPEAGFKINNASDGWIVEGTVLDVSNLSKDADSYYWDFGNGIYSSEKIPTDVSFSPCGKTFTITLVVTSKSGNTDSLSQTFTTLCSGKHPYNGG
jgi:PKD repeat protein